MGIGQVRQQQLIRHEIGAGGELVGDERQPPQIIGVKRLDEADIQRFGQPLVAAGRSQWSIPQHATPSQPGRRCGRAHGAGSHGRC